MDSLNQEKFLASLVERINELEKAVNAIGYDAKASKRRRFPTKKQESVLRGITRAMCVETIDPWKENRVRFFHPMLHEPGVPLHSLPFANPVSSMGGFDDCGLNWVPPAGSTLLLFFEGGSRDAPFYIGTTWHRDRGPGGRQLTEVYPNIREWQSVYSGHRKGYLVGPDDESQVFPPWNTENYNASDIDNIENFAKDPLEQKRATYPHIYGFKTPEKHMLKMVDGNAKCNRRWKRIEILSGCGNWMIFKDDHLHYGGQWSHPNCPPHPGGQELDVCSTHKDPLPYYTDIHGKPIEGKSLCEPQCEGTLPAQCSKILGGHTPTPCDPQTKYCGSQIGTNPFFKHKNECRPYRGPGTPQNNRCDLPQTGIQFLSIGGHTWVMDDSVEEPRGKPEWERSMQPFDFGCNDKCLGRMYIKSMTGHSMMFSDVEELSCLRGKENFIRIKSASGNRIELNDHTVGEKGCGISCPPRYAGQERGIHLQSTSNHVIKMIDHMNKQCSPTRKEGGVPSPDATEAFIQIKSGYGLEMMYNDANHQRITQRQWIQITHPQCVDPQTDNKCNSCDSKECRGPHFLRFQGRPKGRPGIVFLRAGGHSIRQTYDFDIVIVGDKEKNPSDKFTYVSRKHIRATEDIDFRYSGQLHILFAEKQILLMAGRDCPPPPGKKCKGPCLYNVIVARCPVFCPLTGILHWTEKAMSERVFASAYHPCQVPCGGGCEEYEQRMATAQNQPCKEDEEEIDIDADFSKDFKDVKVQTQPGSTKVDPNTGSTIGQQNPPGNTPPKI
jgi:hypothetical protein